MDKAYKSLCKKELHTLETLSLFESAIIYAEYHRGEGTATAVQTKLLGHVTSQLSASSSKFSASEISVLEELKDNLERTPLTDETVNQWTLNQFFKLCSPAPNTR